MLENPFERNGEIISSRRDGLLIYHRIDNPFVFTVVCLPQSEGSYLCEWWVTGTTEPFPGESPPVLLLNLVMGLGNLTRSDRLSAVPSALMQFWEERIQELTYASALANGIVADPGKLRGYSEAIQSELINLHLGSHDSLEQFSPQDKRKKNLTLRTAFMYQLLRSMGVTKIPQTISEFESWNFAGNLLELEKGEEITLSVVTVNQRLAQARKLGVIKSGAAKKGRNPSAAQVMRRKGLSAERDEFLTIKGAEGGTEKTGIYE
jgi:hypothetical protein